MFYWYSLINISILWQSLSILVVVIMSFSIGHNVLQLQEVGDFEAQNCLASLNLIRSTKTHLTTEPPISCRCCCKLWLFFHLVLLLSIFAKFYFTKQFVLKMYFSPSITFSPECSRLCSNNNAAPFFAEYFILSVTKKVSPPIKLSFR